MLDGYVQANGIYMNGQTFPIDMNLIPNFEETLTMSFIPQATAGYIFGGRNSNSTSSAGQFNFYDQKTGNNYFGYGSGRSSFSNNNDGIMKLSFYNGTLQEIDKDGFIRSITRTPTDVNNTSGIIIGGLKNASAISPAPVGLVMCDVVYSFKYASEYEIRYIPAVEEATNTVGFIEDYSNQYMPDTFIPCGSFTNMFKVSVQHGEGGRAYIKDIMDNEISKMYAYKDIPVRIIAQAEPGYVFDYWEVVGADTPKDTEIDVLISEDTTFKAHFKKVVEMDFDTGYHVIALDYGVENRTQTDVVYSKIIDAQVVFDSTQDATTTITLDNPQYKFQLNTPIFIYDPRGNIVYGGIIKAQQENVLTCREPLSIFDNEFLFRVSSASGDNNINLTKYVVDYVFYHYMTYAKYGTDKSNTDATLFRRRMFEAFKFIYKRNPSIANLLPFEKTLPLISPIEVRNLKEYLADITNNFYVYAKMDLIKEYATPSDEDGVYYAAIRPYLSSELPKLRLSVNVDAISNVSIVVEDPEYTILVIYNSTGTTFRAMYVVWGDAVEQVKDADWEQQTSIQAYSNYKVKIEMTDDTDVTSLVNELLSSGQYNHRITFTLDLHNNFYDIRTFEIGQKIGFYDGSKYYDSIITGKKFNIDMNDDTIKSVDITLGKVRQTLTSKIILENKKKKK